MIQLLLLATWLGATSLHAASTPTLPSNDARARELKDYIRKEGPRFTQRESQRKNVLEDLDLLNADQNAVRQRIVGIDQSHQELTMALENLNVEVGKQKQLEDQERRRMSLLLKLGYKIKREGMIRFIITGEDLGALAGRIRILYFTLRSHSVLTRQLADRATRLGESERRLGAAKEEIQKLLGELKEQEGILEDFQKKKHEVLLGLNQKQGLYQAALREYKQVSKQVSTLFDGFESLREADPANDLVRNPTRGTLPLPVEMGRIVKNFGRSVHERFHTVTYHKGIEIEAEHRSTVSAILAGVVEYEGWLKGLGNVVILHHGNGLYSLSAHLYQTMRGRGTHVQQGETIGLVGDTGTSEKPSLYFEIRENAKAVDPLVYFSPKALATLK